MIKQGKMRQKIQSLMRGVKTRKNLDGKKFKSNIK